MNRAIACVGFGMLLSCASSEAQQAFTLEQVMSAPFPANLVAAKAGNRLAWTLDQEGKRNIWVAEGPSFTARELTSYNEDDGEEMSELHFTAEGNAIVYVRGSGKNSAGEYTNPTSNPKGTEQTVWKVSWSGGPPQKIDAGHSPRVSAQGRIAYARGGQIWLAPAQENEKPKQVVVRGENEPAEWSPDGARLAFVSERGDHSFIGIYDAAAQTVRFVAPTVDRDSDAVWSLDGKKIAFVRRPAVRRDTPEGYFIRPDKPHPWSIWVAGAQSEEGHELWHSGPAEQDSYPYMAHDTGGGVLNWAAENRIVFAGEQDGWQHLYSIPAEGGAAKLLTPGSGEVEQWAFSPDRKTILFNTNHSVIAKHPWSGRDVDRRHLWRVSVSGEGLEQVTSSEQDDGIEWAPVVLSDGMAFAYLSSAATQAARPYVGNLPRGNLLALVHPLAPETWPTDFPSEKLVVPQQVIFNSSDGPEIHGQLFLPKNLKAGEKRAALIFLHGGPMRQMLLGWHYMYYYSNAYAMNQYLASRGYVVLAINYRSGIGYGRTFREAPGRAGRGASEYQDVVAAGKYLQARADVDAKKIGLWGGSYGGYLTALGLGRNSDLFAAGVDMHGVHDWPTDNWEGKNIPAELTKLAHDSSPITSVDSWKSPVLFIHGDDDRTVLFSQTVDLIARLRAKGVSIEQLIFPDEIHDFLLHRDWIKAYQASSDFFDRQFRTPTK